MKNKGRNDVISVGKAVWDWSPSPSLMCGISLISLPPSAAKIPSRPRLHLTGATHDFTENVHLRSERRSRMTQGVSCR